VRGDPESPASTYPLHRQERTICGRSGHNAARRMVTNRTCASAFPPVCDQSTDEPGGRTAEVDAAHPAFPPRPQSADPCTSRGRSGRPSPAPCENLLYSVKAPAPPGRAAGGAGAPSSPDVPGCHQQQDGRLISRLMPSECRADRWMLVLDPTLRASFWWRIGLIDTEEVTGSNPVSPTSK
jgi:hypothetical protein